MSRPGRAVGFRQQSPQKESPFLHFRNRASKRPLAVAAVQPDGQIDSGTAAARHHLVIAGTGRAGTTFLVDFLGGCGLDTGRDDPGRWDLARAGREHALDSAGELPYVVKDPWLATYCEDLDLSRIAIDTLIVPIRELCRAGGGEPGAPGARGDRGD